MAPPMEAAELVVAERRAAWLCASRLLSRKERE
jgi:hypothetical protein